MVEVDDREISFDYFGVTGTTDFNHREMVQLSLYLEEIGATHRLEIFNGGHSWPPAELASSSIDWFELQRMRRKQTPIDEGFVEQQLEMARERFDSANGVLERERRCREIERDFEGLKGDDAVSEQCRTLGADRAFASAVKQRKKLFDQEVIFIQRRLGPWLAKFRNTEQAPSTVKRSLIDLQVGSLQKKAAATEDLEAGVFGATSPRQSLRRCFLLSAP